MYTIITKRIVRVSKPNTNFDIVEDRPRLDWDLHQLLRTQISDFSTFCLLRPRNIVVRQELRYQRVGIFCSCLDESCEPLGYVLCMWGYRDSGAQSQWSVLLKLYFRGRYNYYLMIWECLQSLQTKLSGIWKNFILVVFYWRTIFLITTIIKKDIQIY